MYFYIVHQINQAIRKKNDTDGAVNTRTLMFGGILYILTSALINNPNSSLYFYKAYLWYVLLLDICVMATNYKLYYGRSIINELSPYEKDLYDKENHQYKNLDQLTYQDRIKNYILGNNKQKIKQEIKQDNKELKNIPLNNKENTSNTSSTCTSSSYISKNKDNNVINNNIINNNQVDDIKKSHNEESTIKGESDVLLINTPVKNQ
jgi:hypothetical protein